MSSFVAWCAVGGRGVKCHPNADEVRVHVPVLEFRKPCSPMYPSTSHASDVMRPTTLFQLFGEWNASHAVSSNRAQRKLPRAAWASLQKHPYLIGNKASARSLVVTSTAPTMVVANTWPPAECRPSPPFFSSTNLFQGPVYCTVLFLDII